MSSRSLYRRHSAQFKLPLCTDIRNGKIGRREARRTDQISANLIQLWLSQYDRGELNAEEATATTISEYEAKLRRWSAKSVHSRWRLTGLKKRHGDLSIPTASSHPSSAAPWPLHPAGVSNDSTSAQYLLLSRPDASAQLER